MLKMVGSACIDASPDKVWNVLSDIENIPKWSEVVLSALVSSNVKKGIGAERVCELKNGITIRERWIEWEEGQYFTYEGFNLPLVKSARNTWSITIENDKKTLLKTESEVVLKGGIFGRLLEPIMRLASNRIGADALAAFKYLVENDRPFEFKHSMLPRVSAVC